MGLIVFLISFSFIALVALYPFFSYLKGIISPNPIVPDFNLSLPFSIVLACYNEEKYIVEKVAHLLDEIELFPESELLVFSTGSTDNTDELLKHFENHPQIKITFGPRITKIDALNILVPSTKNDLLVFSDCRQVMKSGSIQQLIGYFVDDEIGTVSCTMCDTAHNSSFFRKLYLKMAQLDMRYGSSLNLYGALYAQRKSVFRPIPEHLLFDDFFVAISTLAQKKRLLQSKDAILYDVPFKNYYTPERCQRLARGLLLFLFSEFELLRKVPFQTRWRIYVYKYFKLLLPIFSLICIISFVSLFDFRTAYMLILTASLIFSLFLAFEKTRNFILFLIRINWYFTKAVFGYVFLNQRSKHWEKLRIARREFNSDPKLNL